jgi:ubiquinone/menaquinone biosynthesis C-methylase UbiE
MLSMTTASLEFQPYRVPGSQPAPSPDKIFDTLTAYQHTAALAAAIELDLFSAIGDGHNSVASLSKKANASERAVRMLCDAMVVVGFLNKDQSSYGLTVDSAVFLDKKSQAYVGTAKNFLASAFMMEAYKDLAVVVRTGCPLTEHSFAGIEHPIWIEFARSMAPLVHLPARETAKLIDSQGAIKVLDIAAGHGLFGIMIAQRNPKAQIVALDFPSVLAVAKENAARAGVADRHRLLPGDVLEVELGTGFDVVLVPNLLHGFDRASNERILKKVYDALAPNGRAVVVAPSPNEDRISPRMPALFALMMLGNTEGDAYTLAENQAMLSSAGFSRCELHPLLPTSFTAFVATK